MDYKEKYEQALERARQFSEKPYLEDSAEIVEYIFPELAESEDERMKEAIIATIHLYYGEPLEDEAKEMIAWLEKQGAKVSAIEGFETEFERQVSGLIASAINKEYKYNQNYVKWTANALLNYAKRELEKTGEQKPTDNEMIEILRAEYEKGRADAIEEMQNHTWSEEDEAMWEEISDMLWEGYKQSCSRFTWDDIRDWIKPKIESFKDRVLPQPKQRRR